jgi:inhibitor of cysteine peptidase
MEKLLKIMAMLLVIAAVVFASGCAGNTKTTENNTSGTPANETLAVAPTNASSQTPAVISTETNLSSEEPEVIPAKILAVTNNTTGNATGNVTAQNRTHISNSERKMAIALSHQKSSGTQNVSE